jgi:hypothetical protein
MLELPPQTAYHGPGGSSTTAPCGTDGITGGAVAWNGCGPFLVAALTPWERNVIMQDARTCA